MDSKKNHYIILSGVLLICLLICLDVWYAPSKYHTEKILSVTGYRATRRSGGPRYLMTTEKNTYTINAGFYFAAAKGGTVTIEKSKYSNSGRSMQIIQAGTLYSMDTSLVRNSGLFFLLYLSVVTILFAVFYEKVTYKPARFQLSVFLGLLAVGALLLHVFV